VPCSGVAFSGNPFYNLEKKMSVKLVVLKSLEEVIADVKELVLEEDGKEKIIGFLLTEPRVLSLSKMVPLNEEEGEKISVNFEKWQPFSDDKQFQIPSDWVVTIAEPLEKLKSSYEEQLNAKERTMSVLEEQSVIAG
jgi:sporulation protein YlmC with PRC-barrel domain